METKIFTRRIHYLILSAILLLVGIIFFGGAYRLYDTPKYLNLTDEQVGTQVLRTYSENAEACRSAGGQWIAGAVDARCSVAYPKPSTDWFIKPEPNPDYDGAVTLANIFGVVGLLALCGVAISAIHGALFTLED